MKKNIIILISIGLILLSCGGAPKSENNSKSENKEDFTAYDKNYWVGTYFATESCNDCVRIEKRLTLKNDYFFDLRVEYIGSDKPNIERYEGIFNIDKETQTIILYQQIGEDYEKTIYKMKKNGLIAEESEIEYRKLFGTGLTGTTWYLRTIKGKQVNQYRIHRLKFAYIEFDTDGNVFGQTRCNNFNGRFDITNEQEMVVSNLATNKMLCPENELEKEYLDVLATPFKYYVVNDTLFFKDKEDQILAKFTIY